MIRIVLLSSLALLTAVACPAPRAKQTTTSKPKPPARGSDPCPMVTIPAGDFLRGTNKGDGEKDESPPRRIYLDPFAIDKHEVTVRQYRVCVSAGACSASLLTGDAMPGKRFGKNPHCNWNHPQRHPHPINCVTWKEADHYCRWVGKRLPTEAEWEKAARGPDGRVFPWGDTRPNCQRAIMIWGGKGGCGKRRTAPVGSVSPKGDSPYGAQDMAGNVYEWVSDWYRKDAYAKSPYINPQGPPSGKQRLVRGGSWYNYGNYLRTAYRTAIAGPDTRLMHVGFRCAKSLPAPQSRPSSLPASAPAPHTPASP